MDKLKELLKDKEKMKHYIIYFVFGVLTTIVSFGSFWLIREFVPALDENIANMISIFLAIVFAYFTNRTYVFKSKEDNILKEFFKFLLSRASSFIFEMVSFWLLTTFAPFSEMLDKLICSFFVIIINYVISRFFVFKKGVENE